MIRFLTTLLIIIALQVQAQQDSSGVYMSSTDFQNRKLAYAINCKTQKHKIKLKSFFSRPFIVVVHNDSSYALTKSEIYGYRDCEGITYRFVDDKVLKILNPFEPIVIYRYFVYTKDPTVEYFFSKGNTAIVEELTRINLKKAFPDNPKFHDLLDSIFETDLDLVRYEKRNKTYKLMRVYTKSLE